MNIATVEKLFSDYAAAWALNDTDKISSYWDPSDTEPFYKAEEVLHFYRKLEDIRGYWQHNERFHEIIRLQFQDFDLKSLPGDYAVVFTKMRWDIKFAEGTTTQDGAAFNHAGKSMGGENHVLALVRDTAAGPRFAGWSETPDAPITYMAQLYQWIADPKLQSG